MKAQDSNQAGIIEFCEQRASVYRMLASLTDREVNEKTAPALVTMGDLKDSADADENEKRCNKGFRVMASCVRHFTEDVENVLACDFARVFLAAGRYDGKAAVPYESIYTSEEEILMQESRDQVRAIFREAGVMPDSKGITNPEDYLPYELEFMAYLNDQMVKAVRENRDVDAADLATQQYRFLHNHLLNWTGKLIEDIDRVAQTAFYRALGEALGGFLACEADDVAALRDECSLQQAC